MNDPFKAIFHYFGDYLNGNFQKPDNISKLHWENHKFSICFVILEFYCLLTNNSIIEMLLEAKKLVYKDT